MTTTARLLFALLLSAGSLAAHPAAAQVSVTTGCTPGIGCSSLRIFLSALEPAVELSTFSVTLAGPALRFLPIGGFGTYSAMDDYGAFAGSTSVAGDGLSMSIDFAEVFFPFTLAATGSVGFVDVMVENTSGLADASGLAGTFSATTAAGAAAGGALNAPTSSVTPEPVSMALLGTGLAGLGVLRRRRRREGARG